MVGIEGGDQRLGYLLDARPVGEPLKDHSVSLAEAQVEPGQPIGDGGDKIGITLAESQILEEPVQRQVRLAIEGLGLHELGFGHPDRVDDDEVILDPGVWRHLLKVGRIDDPHAATLHLLEVRPGLHSTHEEDALQRLHVGAGRDHVHGDSDAGIVGVAELGKEILWSLAGRAVGDLRGEVVALAELLPNDVDDVLGVRVVLGENQGLRDLGPAGENLGEEPILEGPDHRSDLVGGNDGAIKLTASVLKLLIVHLPAAFPRCAFAVPNVDPSFEFAARLRHLCLDAVYVEAHVDMVGYRLFVGVLHH